ncbi:Mitochondrial import inner membrane translocase subunit tim16 [Trametes pubescens]|uniref:Mitochondrial import inner membrane translocase subunit TIM16 n=1 Tax=Trametes pubescens TaxID=154538 RepID=A0A1M2V429_TRAPU|nr:Mitochondrial import inner membrane translocase subunit tim16 [Trametes pubescens]
MSSPKVIVQIAIAGARIFGRAFAAAGRQAIQNAKYRPPGAGGADVAGVGNATSGSLTDRLTREHRMTADEARLILNVKKEDTVERIVQNYEHLFKANSPPEKVPKPAPGKQPLPTNSHYLQSKVVRAKERLEAELKVPEEEAAAPPPPPDAPTTPPPSS